MNNPVNPMLNNLKEVILNESTPIKKKVIVDHVTKRKLPDNSKERIRQDLELLIHNTYSFPFNKLEIDTIVPIPNKNNIVSTIDLAIKNDEKIIMLFKIIESNQETDSLKNMFRTAFANIDSLQYCVDYDGVNLNVYKYSDRLIKIPDFPSFKELNSNQILRKDDLIPADKHLKQIFKSIHNHLYANSNIRIASRLGEEIVKLILCKIEDEASREIECKFSASNIESEKDVKLKVNRLWDQISLRLPSYTNEKISLDDSSVYYVVKRLQKFMFTNTQSDILGESFQIFIDQSRLQDLGAFFTEVQAVKLAMEMLDIKIGEDNFIDPFQGTGGFIQEFYNKTSEKLQGSELQAYCSDNLSGIDIEEEIIKISEAKMITLGRVKYNSFNENSLENPSNWSNETQKKVLLNSFSKIGTNPPFGTKISIQSQDILKQYELSKTWKREYIEGKYIWSISSDGRKRNPRVPDILGLERVVQLLKTPSIDGQEKGGMAAVVLPRQIFSGPKELYVREWIMRNTIVHAIIDLPMETFQPHTGTKASIIVFTKRSEPKIDWYNEKREIFMSIPSKIGHDRRGHAIFKRDSNGILIENQNDGEYIIDTDMPKIFESWKKYCKKENLAFNEDLSFTIDFQSIDLEDLRLDASYYSPKTAGINEYIEKLPVITNGEWEVKPLGSLVKDVYFPGRFKRNYVKKEHGIPFLSGTNISQYDPVNVKYLSKETKNLDKYLIKKDWILVTRSGTTGIVALSPEYWEDVAVSDHVIRVVPDESIMNVGYVYVFLKSEYGQTLLEKGVYGSVVDEITPEFIKNIPIPFPSNKKLCETIGKMIVTANEYKSKSINLFNEAEKLLKTNINQVLK